MGKLRFNYDAAPQPPRGSRLEVVKKSLFHADFDFNKCENTFRSFYSKWLPLGGWGGNISKSPQFQM